MKIRIKENSIRFRLNKKDIAAFGREGFIEEKTDFLNGPPFRYSLQMKKGIDALEAAFSDNRISIYVPETMVTEWTSTDVVGFENNMETGNGQHLFLLIEKDFVCLDHSREDQSDNYPNPDTVC
jgi:hypothetical protein